MSAESLAILRGELNDYQIGLRKGVEAQAKGRAEVNNLATDAAGLFYETGRKVVDAAINIVPDALNLVLFPDFSTHTKDEPSFGRAKVGEMYDELSSQIDPNYAGNPLPRIETSAVKYDFRSEMMRRDINGKLDGDGTKAGDAITTTASIIAPLVVGKVLIPAESPQSLKTLGGLPEIETTTTIANSRTLPSMTPDKTRIPEGKPKILDLSDTDPDNIRGTVRENESAKVLAENGYKVEQLSDKIKGKIQGDKKPDFKVEDKVFDNFAPSKNKPARNIWSSLRDKITDPKTGAKQADRFVLNMNDSKLTVAEMTKQFKNFPLKGLEEILIIKDGKVIHFFPFDK